MDTLFLVLGLFLPRITLLLYYFFLGGVPFNTVPFILDIVLAIFLPRVLIIIYIAATLGTASPWFWIHLAVAIFVYIFSGNKYRKKRRNY